MPALSVDVPERIEGMPLTDVRLVNIKLITLAELKLVSGLQLGPGWAGLFDGVEWRLDKHRLHAAREVQASALTHLLPAHCYSQITDRGAEGRRKLSELLQGPDRLVSSIRRESVL